MSELSTLPAPAVLGRTLRWLAIGAVIVVLLGLLLPLSGIGLILLLALLVPVALVAFGGAPPAWLACADPDTVGSFRPLALGVLAALAVIAVIVFLGGPVLLVLLGLVTVLFALGWSGIGPLAAVATVVRGLFALIALLPKLRGPLDDTVKALASLAGAMDALRGGLDDAERHVGQARADLAAIQVETVAVKLTSTSVDLPNHLGSFSMPFVEVTPGTATPFADVVSPELLLVQKGLAAARAAAETQRDVLRLTGTAVAALRDLIPRA